MPVLFDEIARLPAPDDNVAIATRNLVAGTQISHNDVDYTLSHNVLVGHRFAVRPIAVGEALLSWGQTFGNAIQPISAGEYVSNADVLKELGRRELDFELPTAPNFVDDLATYAFDEATFTPALPLPRYDDVRTFAGYRRDGGRGVGTRNMIVLLGTTSLTSGFVRTLEARLQETLVNFPNIDGIVAVAHTEGGHGEPNNRDLLLRTLAGFMVHPNVGAVLAVDYGHEAINNAVLEMYLMQNDYPIADIPHHFMSLSNTFEDDLARGDTLIRDWLETVNSFPRTAEPLSELKIALQCGGSDAYSGVSGNPLAAWVAKQVIQYGGSANLAETDELIGAETYVLDKVRDSATAKKFLSFVERFKERVAWHGHSAHGNPSGGNKYRGLYNIYLKSLGAAMKRDPEVPLDFVIEYGERMQDGGYYFMDSPGNDLESIAGQVASGCNMIFFVTGNGSITNFPFVPTLKIVTTTDRFNLLSAEMDVNAGAYLDGTPLEELGAITLEQTINVASGERSVGERAGHAQVQIWRDWLQVSPADVQQLRSIHFNGKPLEIVADVDVPDVHFPVYQAPQGYTTDQVGLILPTSLCSGQIARMCVDQLNKHHLANKTVLSHFVTLVHTEGCGGSVNNEFRDTLLGYLSHPFVKHALLLEHGCESTHNAFFREAMMERGYMPEDYGWASIQMDGGIQNVLLKMRDWFDAQLANDAPHIMTHAGLEAVRLALVTQGELDAVTTNALATLTKMIVSAGGTVVISEQDALLKSEFVAQLGLGADFRPSVGYGQVINASGFHIMAAPTKDWGELLTGLGATGMEIILAHTGTQAMPGHPMIPVLQVAGADLISGSPDVDLQLSGLADEQVKQVLAGIVSTLSHEYTPKSTQSGNVYFQITRGLLGVSL
ncbi:MAG: UxaA family hydrolase [Aggregatilineales bacterium]